MSINRWTDKASVIWIELESITPLSEVSQTERQMPHGITYVGIKNDRDELCMKQK